MAVTIKQTESAPESYPDIFGDSDGITLSTDAAALDPAMLWQRIESYIAYRWSARDVTWIVEGPGEWAPPLSPASIGTVEAWSRGADEWETASLNASPLGGYWLPCSGPFRFSGVVGADADVPAAVQEAFRRLAEYLGAASEDDNPVGASRFTLTVSELTEETERRPEWLARAMQNSGAADLLRPYRRA